MVAIRDSSLGLMLVHFSCIQVFEKIAFLALIIANIESIASHVLLLAVEIFDHWERCVVIGTLLHGWPVVVMLHTRSKAILVRDLARRVSHRRLNDSIRVGLHNFLARSRLTRHSLSVSSASTRIIPLVLVAPAVL